MADSPSTRPSLLVRLRDSQDHEAWTQFVNVYGPLIYGFARRQGLQDADAADLTQEVLQAVAGAIRGLDYDPTRGSFRGWLFTVVRSRLSNFRRRRRSHLDEGSGDTAVQQTLAGVPAPDHDGAWWDQEHERRLFAWAAEQVRPAVEPGTWRAFWGTAVEGRATKDVAADLAMTPGAVRVAKSRVLHRLRAELGDLRE